VLFEDLGRRVAGELPGFDWNSLPAVDRRKGLIPLAAGTVDGRLPGHRERMPLDGSGNGEWSRLPNP
jgi:NADH-quinone oxidoreductase subunit G